MSTSPIDHQLHCRCSRCRDRSGVKVYEPSASLLEANYHAALARLVKRSQPIRDYYAKLLKWDGGCALPEDPSKGAQSDFVEALDAFKDASEVWQKAKAKR